MFRGFFVRIGFAYSFEIMEVKKGDKVKVEYEGKFEDGEVFDSSNRSGTQQPLEFEAGAGMVVKGFDEAVIGMKKDDEKEFTLKPEEAYGQHNPQLKQDIPRNVLPQDQEPKEGMMLMAATPDGKQIPAKIVGVSEDKVTIDLNHPLAGKTLIFKIKIVDIGRGSQDQ